jgi:hypothetical protein
MIKEGYRAVNFIESYSSRDALDGLYSMSRMKQEEAGHGVRVILKDWCRPVRTALLLLLHLADELVTS